MKKTKKVTKNRKKTTPPKGFLAYHIAASLISIAPRFHTGRPIHHRHTSHGVLLVALLFTGMILFNNLGTLRAYGLQGSDSTTVTVNIAGDPPTIGADITFPVTDSSTKSPELQVAGTCPPQLLVSIYNNGIFAGSTICTSDGTYEVIIQLVAGVNTLQAQDYDGLNQPGPTTDQVSITYDKPVVPVQPVQPIHPIAPIIPVVARTPKDITPIVNPTPVAPAPQPTINPCFDTAKTDALNSNEPTIIASCIKRNVFIGDSFSLPVRIVGGTSPYTLSIDWGDTMTEQKTVLDTNYHTYPHTYTTAGIIGVSLRVTDAQGAASYLHTLVQINGPVAVAGSSSALTQFISNLRSLWTEAPVPLYVSAVTLVLGFWIGDVAQRLLFKGPRYAKVYSKKSSAHYPRRRHP